MPLRLVISIAALFALTSATAARAQEEPYRVPAEIERQPVLPDDVDVSAARRLRLQDAIQIAVERNLGIALSREQALAADATIGLALGRFEPIVAGVYGHTDADTPPTVMQLQQGIQASALNVVGDGWSLSLSDRLPLGTQLSLTMTNVRSLASSGTYPLLYNSGLALQLTQPLLRGFAFDLAVPRVDVLRARFASSRAREDVRAAMIATVRGTDNAYWDLVSALKNYEVQRASLELARTQLGLTQRQIDAGILAPSDLIGAESTLAQRQLNLVQAESQIAQVADQLRRVLNLPADQWQTVLLPIDPPRFDETRVDLTEANTVALRSRPEIAQRRLDLSRAGLDLRVARTDRLPQLDAGFSYGVAGQRMTYSDTLDQLLSRDVPAWTATLNLTWAPLLRGARAEVAGAEAAVRQAQLAIEQQRADLFLELRDDLRTLSTAAREVRAAARLRDLTARALDAEQRKFLNGTSNNIFVAQRQADVAQARLAELNALIRHQKARTALEAAMGVLLEQRGIRLEAAP